MGKSGAQKAKKKFNYINLSCVYAYIRNRKHARTKNGSVPTANARAFLLVRRNECILRGCVKVFDRRFIF